ncbi:MAG: hypothetical protein AVDCRST_MAG49-4379, partial [uncultured Thermomicrobiales bacterium]
WPAGSSLGPKHPSGRVDVAAPPPEEAIPRWVVRRGCGAARRPSRAR